MALASYEDFLHLGMNNLTDYLAARGMKTTGRKIELVARAFSAFEMKIGIVASSAELQEQLKNEYAKKNKKINACDPWSVDESCRVDDITSWPKIDIGKIFAYILRVRDFDTDYIGRYKDQKAYSFFDSAFVDAIYTFQPDPSKIFLYGKVQASQTVTESRNLWIVVKQLPYLEIFTCHCDCMAGCSASCNHVIATLYKIEYANRQGWVDPTCTSIHCLWNK